MDSPVLSSASTSSYGVALLFLAPVVTAALGYFGARYTATAPLQASMNDAFRTLMDEWQTQHAQDTARILELEAEVLRQRGTINQGLQREQSMQHIIDRLRAAIDSEP